MLYHVQHETSFFVNEQLYLQCGASRRNRADLVEAMNDTFPRDLEVAKVR